MRRRPALALPWLCWAALAGCGGLPAPASAPAAELVAGPLRWLMLPDEEREARRLHTSREAVDFLEAFWRRRNPDPSRPTNERARLFHERVEAADRLYGEEGIRGSLTDRGRALILLGPPPVLRYSQRRIPSWEPGRSLGPPAVRTRQVAVETWVYPRNELEPALAALVADLPTGAGGEAATLVFLADSPVHTRLQEGETLLELAARAQVRPAP